MGSQEHCLKAIKVLETLQGIGSRPDLSKKREGHAIAPNKRVGWFSTESKSTYIYSPPGWGYTLGLYQLHLVVSLRTTNQEDIYPVFSALQDAVRNGHDPENAWALVCSATDGVEDRIREGIPLPPIPSCPGCRELHLCPTCFYNRPCARFVDDDSYDHKICSSCATTTATASNRGGTEVVRKLRNALQKRVTHDNKAGKLGLDFEDISIRTNDIMEELLPLILTETTAFDNFIDQTLEFSRDVLPAWNGKSYHPLTPSIDSFMPIVKQLNGKTGCHYPGNVSITSDSLNHMFRHYPKYLLYPLTRMVATFDPEVYSRSLGVFRDSLINDYEIRPFSEAHASRRIGLPCPANIDEILHALRSGKLLPRTVPKVIVWRTTLRSRGASQNWQFPDFAYHLRQLHLAAQRYGLDTDELRCCWLRDGVFFPFALDSVVLHWTWYDCLLFFVEKLKRMRAECDHLFKNQANRPDCSAGELMLTVAYLHLRKVATDLEKGYPLRLAGHDEAGLVLHPTIRFLLTSSIGHKHHGRQMLTGLLNYNPSKESDCTFDPDVCNICWETQACNQLKFTYHEDYYDAVLFAQLYKQPRDKPMDNTPVSLPPGDEIWSELRDEVNYDVPVKAKGHDATDEVLDDFEDDDLDSRQAPGDIDDDGPGGNGYGDSENVRCPCGASSSEELFFHDMVQCPRCRTLQHTVCMGINGQHGPENYLCHLCRTGDDVSPSIVPLKRDIGRLGMTCYMSAATQLAFALKEVTAIVKGSNPFRLVTGRDRSDLEFLDKSTGKENIAAFYRSLYNIYAELQIPSGL